ncbi:MAG TPA: hypothetical protein VI112_17935, partial [Bacteroidia bacterium]
MGKILPFIFLTITLALKGQTKNYLKENKPVINIESIDHICIAAYCSPIDSCRNTPYQLSKTMVEALIGKLNKSISKNSCSLTERYLLYV